MASQTPVRLTYISADDALIKAYGVVDNERYQLVENILSAYSEKLSQGLGIPRSPNDLLPGKLVLVFCQASGQYRRAQIICMADNSTTQRKLLVKLIDFGMSTLVDVTDIRCLDSISHITHSVPETPLAVEYILYGCIRSRPWTKEDLEFANRITVIHTEMTLMGIVCNQPIINIMLADNKTNNRVTFTKCLVDRGCVAPVQAEQQKSMIRSKYEAVPIAANQFQTPPPLFPTSAQTMSAPSPAMSVPSYPYSQVQPTAAPLYHQSYSPTMAVNCPRLRMCRPAPPQQAVSQQYILDTLPVGSTHEVYVSHVIDGMQNFTIQIKRNVDDKLTKLMALINDTPPEPFTDPVQPGTVCLGRYSADGSLCRAVVSTVLAEGANLYFVDFGNSEIVSFDEIYKMPPAFMEEKVMAIRFTLADLTKYSLTTQEAQDIFRDLVMNEESLIMHVTKPEMPLKQYCELSMLVGGKAVNVKNMILDKVKLMKPAEYQKIHFKQGNTTDVIVSYIESPIRFFVQLELNQSMLDLLMVSVEKYCTTAENKEVLYVEDVNENMAVCALYPDDQKWYRGLIIDEPDANGNVAVFFVDYGNQENTHFSKLRVMNNEMISKFPMQAIECRLDVNADLALNEAVINHFLDLVEGNSYQMKVLNVLPAHVMLVELIDNKGVNVKDMLQQIAMPSPPIKEPSPASDYSSGSRCTGSRHSSQGNWRERNNSVPNNDNFSAFKREDSRDGQRFARSNYADVNANASWRDRQDNADETDNVAASPPPKKEDFWVDSKKERYPPRRDDSGGKPYRPRDDRRNAEPTNWLSREADGDGGSGGGRPFKPRDDRRGGENNWQSRDNNDGGERRQFKSQKDSWGNKDAGGNSWGGSRDGTGGRKPYQRREDSDAKDNGWKSNHRDGGNSWDMNRDDLRDGRKPYQRREDTDSKEDGWRSSNREAGGGGGGGWNNDSDGRRPYQKREDSRNSESKMDNWKSDSNVAGESGWGGNRDGERKPYQRRDESSKPWEKSDRRERQGGDSWGGKRDDGFKSRSHDSGGGFGSRAPAVTLEPAFEKGAQFVFSEYQPGQQFEAAVSWFVNPAQFYVIPAANDEFRLLMETIQTAYPKRERLNITTLSTDDSVVARDNDNVIYRARVIHGRPGGVLVNFVDYGNSSLVKKDQVWAVSEEHCAVPVQAICCGLHNISTIDENTAWSQVSELEPFFNKDRYLMTCVTCDDKETNSKTWLVNLTNEDGQDVGDLLVAAGLAARKCMLKSEELYDVDLLRHQVLTVFPGHVESSKKFFIHIDPQKVELMRQTIDELVASPQGLMQMPAEQIVEGEFCLGRSEDDAYYRALILSADPTAQTAHILFIDYGDENDVAFDLIKILPENLTIYSPQNVECALYEGESFEDEEGFASAITDVDFMIRVMDVIGDKLLVHVFDINGARLPYPIAIEETISALCPLPVLRSYDSVIVSHITNEKVYIQRVVDEKDMTDLGNELAEMYETGEQEKVAVEAGQFYAAKSGAFETWYRCKPVGPDCQTVFYIDYGSTESVDQLLAIRPLDKKFFASPEFCVGVTCAVQFTAEDLMPLYYAVQETVFAVSFESTGPNEWRADLKVEGTGKTFAEFAVETNCGAAPEADQCAPVAYDAADGWQLDAEQCVVLCHANTPEDFFVRKAGDDLDTVTRMQDGLQSALKEVLPLVGPSPGDQLVAAQNPADGKWYRARVADKNAALAVDFGFALKSPRLKKLPKAFLRDTTSRYTIACGLNVQPCGERWEADAVARFGELVAVDAEVVAKLEFVKGDKRFVDLKVAGASVSDTLVTEGVAKWKLHPVVVAHATSLREFCVRDSDRESEFCAMGERLLKAAEWEAVAEPAVGDLVAGQSDDERWYRVAVTRVEVDVRHVKFVDYGNESPCSQFRRLPDELRTVPAFATRCTLTPLPENAAELDELFVEFVAAALEGVLTIYILGGCTPMPVMLEYDGRPIDEVLLQKKAARESGPAPADVGDSVVVSHINSPSSFYVQSDSAATYEVEKVLAAIENAAAVTEFAVGDVVAAKYAEDGLWYRAVVTAVAEGVATVLFLDYGNASAVEEVRSLPDEARVIARLAKHCAIPIPAEMQQWPEAASARFAELTCNGNTVFRMTVRREGDPALVDLQDNGTNVADELSTLCKADDLTAPAGGAADQSVVCLSHACAPNTVWVQWQTPQIDEMITEMATADTFDELATAEEGTLVAAQFDEDGQWYRARVLRQAEEPPAARHAVLFIDYGNEAAVSLVKSLPADLVTLPPLAKRCRLKGVSQAAAERLRTLVDDGVTFAVSEMLELHGELVVSLNYADDGRSLNAELAGGKAVGAAEAGENDAATTTDDGRQEQQADEATDGQLEADDEATADERRIGFGAPAASVNEKECGEADGEQSEPQKVHGDSTEETGATAAKEAAESTNECEKILVHVLECANSDDDIAEDESDKYTTPSSKTSDDYVTPDTLTTSIESDMLNTSFYCEFSSPTDAAEAAATAAAAAAAPRDTDGKFEDLESSGVSVGVSDDGVFESDQITSSPVVDAALIARVSEPRFVDESECGKTIDGLRAADCETGDEIAAEVGDLSTSATPPIDMLAEAEQNVDSAESSVSVESALDTSGTMSVSVENESSENETTAEADVPVSAAVVAETSASVDEFGENEDMSASLVEVHDGEVEELISDEPSGAPATDVLETPGESANVESPASASAIEGFDGRTCTTVEPECGETDELVSSLLTKTATEVSAEQTSAEGEPESNKSEELRYVCLAGAAVEFPDDKTPAEVEPATDETAELEFHSLANLVVEVPDAEISPAKVVPKSDDTDELVSSSLPTNPVIEVPNYQTQAAETKPREAELVSSTPANAVLEDGSNRTLVAVKTQPHPVPQLESSLPANAAIEVPDATAMIVHAESGIEIEKSTDKDVAAASTATPVKTAAKVDESELSKTTAEDLESSASTSAESERATIYIATGKPAQVEPAGGAVHLAFLPPSTEVENESCRMSATAVGAESRERRPGTAWTASPTSAVPPADRKLVEIENSESRSTDEVSVSRPEPLSIARHEDAAEAEVAGPKGSKGDELESAGNDRGAVGVAPHSERTLLEECEFVATRVDSPASFYLRKVNDMGRLAEMETALQAIDTSERSKLEHPDVDQLVAAKIANVWLRVCVVMRNHLSGFMVKCVDYGNVCSCTTVFQLPEALLQVPPLALHCALRLPTSRQFWPKRACQQFFDMTMTCPRVFTIKLLEETDYVKYVELLDKEEGSVTEKVVALCDDDDEADSV